MSRVTKEQDDAWTKADGRGCACATMYALQGLHSIYHGLSSLAASRLTREQSETCRRAIYCAIGGIDLLSQVVGPLLAEKAEDYAWCFIEKERK